ncbi:chemotaxis protein CheB [Luteolibacter luteus]|uniref:protein-glutamate methylesterase n=1 Tax=Luteolibacter luteus TaxID=2728835 RepID=A0A858RP14_9BACT|nr:chemotaxis protein CheB [Luteolibacter luteus]QJE98767.1 chemotaxis protein CheB [Luteolibacter luteus]
MSEDQTDPAAVVIGASVGAIGALGTLLPELPADFPMPVLVVVHIPPEGRSSLPELFASRCALPVKEAEDKEEILPGTIYFAPANYHLLVEPDFRIALSNEEPVLFSRPAIDLLFESAADAYGTSLTGVILTGASSDGAHGLAAVAQSGGTALVQDPATAEGQVMPLAALDACPQARALGLPQISTFLRQLTPNS